MTPHTEVPSGTSEGVVAFVAPFAHGRFARGPFMRCWASEDGPAVAQANSVGVNTTAGWVDFDALIEPMPWGRNVYTILRLDETLKVAAKGAGTRRVEGTIEDVAVNVGLNRADILPDAFMYVGKGLQRRLGSRPGDVVRCRLRPADPNKVPIADDILQALADAGLLAAFQRKTPAQRRRLLQPIEEAATSETRQRRTTAP